MNKPLLLFGYGNPSRGDDALGALVLEFVQHHINLSGLELLTDFQLQVEHALDLQNRQLVLFVDAAVNSGKPFNFSELKAEKDNSYTSHAVSPASVLSVYETVINLPPPPSFMLSLQGANFELGEGLSTIAASNLNLACRFIRQLFDQPAATAWRQKINAD